MKSAEALQERRRAAKLLLPMRTTPDLPPRRRQLDNGAWRRIRAAERRLELEALTTAVQRDEATVVQLERIRTPRQPKLKLKGPGRTPPKKSTECRHCKIDFRSRNLLFRH